MKKPVIYQFQTPREFMAAWLSFRKTDNPSFSLRAWARELGYKNPSFLSEIIRGKRALKLQLIPKIGANLCLKDNEQRYLEILTLVVGGKNDQEKEIYLDMLERIRPQHGAYHFALDRFKLISDWYHLTILEMLNLKDFREETISNRLLGKVTKIEASLAIDRLIRVGLMRRNKDGQLARITSSTVVGENVPSAAIRKHHHQMLDMAKQAVDGQPISIRSISGTTLAMKKADYPQLLKLIDGFHKKIHDMQTHTNADDLYRINVQAFSLTKEEEI